MKIATIGASGTLGRHLVGELRAPEHEVRALPRASRHHPVDITSGPGLAKASEACDVVIDAGNDASGNARATPIDGSRHVNDAARKAAVKHFVRISVLGCGDAPMGHFRLKQAKERVLTEGDVPWRLLYATQFHEYLDKVFGNRTTLRPLPLPHALVSPVAAVEATRGGRAAAVAPHTGRAPDCGPRCATGPTPFDTRIPHFARTPMRTITRCHRRHADVDIVVEPESNRTRTASVEPALFSSARTLHECRQRV